MVANIIGPGTSAAEISIVADEIYEMFLGEPAYDTVKDELGGGARKLSF